MKLPNLDRAFVPPAKIKDYLLSEVNSGGKAEFFTLFGFSVAEWELLAEAIYEHANTHEVKRIASDEHGTKYVIEGELNALNGRRPSIRAVWLLEKGEEFACSITAYPI